jgi:hypothetical protein
MFHRSAKLEKNIQKIDWFIKKVVSLPPKLVIEHIDARESGANPGLYLQL